jgi:hypothetical protein
MMTAEDRAEFEGRGTANTERVSHASSVKALESKRRARLKKDPKPDVTELEHAIEVAKAAEAAAAGAMGEMKNSTRTLIQHSALPAGVDLRGRTVVGAGRRARRTRRLQAVAPRRPARTAVMPRAQTRRRRHVGPATH